MLRKDLNPHLCGRDKETLLCGRLIIWSVQTQCRTLIRISNADKKGQIMLTYVCRFEVSRYYTTTVELLPSFSSVNESEIAKAALG